MDKKKKVILKLNKLAILILILIISLIIIISKDLFPKSKAEEVSVEVVDVIYKTGLDERSVTIRQNVVDKEIGNGRIWIDSLDTIQEKDQEFVSNDEREIIGWKYVGSTISGSPVTETSAYSKGNHFTQDEYYSVSSSETSVTLEAVWGYKVYVDGINGIDDSDGLTANTPVRTMGRAYEVLARINSNNPEANITGFKVIGDSTIGYTQGEEDEENRVTSFDGKIVIINDINYEDKYEGRYLYITYGDLINSPNYNSSTGKVVFNDGVANQTITNLKSITGYSESDPVKLKYSSANNYVAQSKTASGSYHYLLKKELNNYSYEVDGKTYYTYGRLTQYTESLRAHTGKGIMTPKNDGLVLISSKDGETNYKTNSTFYFSEYTRYASGGDIIYKDIELAFYHKKSLDAESENYVGGYAANGNYLVFDDNVTIKYQNGYYFYPNVYGGAHNYRYNSYRFSGESGNKLGDSGDSILDNTRITIKSGTYYAAYGGSYGSTVGKKIDTYGKNENNAAVINVYGGSFSNGIGMGHEGAQAYNSYVYAYGGKYGEIHGSGLGSSGAMTGYGDTNVLINGDVTVKTVHGGSGTGEHAGDINVVFKKGTVSATLYGGCKTKNVNGDIKITITGGTIASVIGGCATGNVTGDVFINMTGGTINGTIYTSGQGNTATETTSYYNGDEDDTGFLEQILDSADSRLNLLITGTDDAEIFEHSKTQFNASATQYHNDYQYEVDSTKYYYPHIYKDDYSKVITGIYRSTYTNHGVTQYTVQRQISTLSLATVSNTSLNITGGTINGDIYGGGKVSVVKGDVNINIGNATINGNVYGGGDGTYEPTVTIYTITGSGQNDKKTTTFTWKGSETFDLSQYDPNKKVPIDYEKKYIYSPTYDYMGGVEGSVEININNNAEITGNVYGGGNAGNVFGNTTIKIDSAIIYKNDNENSGNVYGGGDSGTVQGDTFVTIGNSEDLGITVSGLVYGGGKGYDPDGDGDASSFTTVYGSSKVNIQGTRTNVENYGSVKLGKVANSVDVVFKDYWTGNATAKYKTMNGIDRATTVTFENSYVLLENKDENGNLVGIKDITNLVIPNGSGLKISANGEIAGNFEGGGELYLDSAVCLTVGGNISGVTTLILNPILYTDTNMNVIKGGLQKPYMKVAGEVLNTEEEGQAVVSGEKKYTIYEASKEETETEYIYFYIPQDIQITSEIEVISSSDENRKYKEEINANKDIFITIDGTFTNKIHIDYELTESTTSENEYTNIERKFAIKIEKDKLLEIPKGTQITLINNDEYYFYISPTNITEINLTDFKNVKGEKYNPISNFTTSTLVDKELNQVTGLTTYRYSEEFRFIVDFSNTNTEVTTGVYYPMLNIYDLGEWMDEGQTDIASNTLQIQKRIYEYTYQLDKEKYEGNSKININGELNLSSIPDVQGQNGKKLTAIVKLQDTNGNIINFPENTIVTINNIQCEANRGVAQSSIVENLVNTEIKQEVNIEVNMENILPQNYLEAGKYNLVVEFDVSENGVYGNNNLEKYEIPLNIISYEQENSEIKNNYGIKVDIVNTENEAENVIQLINQDEQKNLQVQYKGNLEQPKVKVTMLEKTEPFKYEETENSKKMQVSVDGTEITEITLLRDMTNIKLHFTNDMKEGTYRILFELYDAYGTKKTEAFVNFIVIKE